MFFPGPAKALDVRTRERPWADHTHVAAQHIEKLRRFIESRGAKPGADAGDLAVAHRAELEDIERLSPKPDALLSEQHRTAVFELDEARGNEEKRREYLATKQRETNIEGASGEIRRRR